MTKVINIDANIPHVVSEVICIGCGYRWLAVRPREVKLKEIECPGCSAIGWTIETGERLEQE